MAPATQTDALPPYDLVMRTRTFLTTDPAAVRAEHLAAYERLIAALDAQASELSETGLRLFRQIALALYIDAGTIDEVTPLSAILGPD
jgi:hypothetical protein